jgi:hypothetical protein
MRRRGGEERKRGREEERKRGREEERRGSEEWKIGESISGASGREENGRGGVRCNLAVESDIPSFKSFFYVKIIGNSVKSNCRLFAMIKNSNHILK